MYGVLLNETFVHLVLRFRICRSWISRRAAKRRRKEEEKKFCGRLFCKEFSIKKKKIDISCGVQTSEWINVNDILKVDEWANIGLAYM
jgi:hypothetical protein